MSHQPFSWPAVGDAGLRIQTVTSPPRRAIQRFKALARGILALSLIYLNVAMPVYGESSHREKSPSASGQKSSKSSTQNVAPTMLPACGEELMSATAPGVQTVRIAEGERPGATDPLKVPAGRYALFPDHGIAAFSPHKQGIGTVYYTTDESADLKLTNRAILQTAPLDPHGYGAGQIFATAGRFLNADQDQLVTLTRDNDPSSAGTLYIRFLDNFTPFYLSNNLLPRVHDSSDFVAITHADLDQKAGPDGNLHDELILAYANGESSGNYTYTVGVVNYAAGTITYPQIAGAKITAQAPQFNTSTSPGGQGGVLPTDNIVAVTAGDFEGDGKREIAVATLGNDKVTVHIFRYEVVDDLGVLTQVRQQDFSGSSLLAGPAGDFNFVGTISLVAGDFDGDGADELVLATSRWNKPTNDSSDGSYAVGLTSLKVGSDFQISVKDTKEVATFSEQQGLYEHGRPRVALAAGQFLFDASHPLGRKQLVVAWRQNTRSTGGFTTRAVYLRPYSVSNAGVLTRIGTEDQSVSTSGNIRMFSLAAGGFQGMKAGAPVSSLALSVWSGEPTTKTSRFALSTYTVTNNGIDSKSSKWTDEGGVDLRARLPVVAFDLPGNSAYLGDPIRFTLLEVPQTDFIMQEPPKHAYWDESKHEIVNLTRFDQNNVQLFNGSKASMATTGRDTSSFTVGGAASASASGTITAKGGISIIQLKGEAKLEGQVKGEYDYSHNKEGYNQHYHSRSTESMGSTDRDDYVKGDAQLIDVWRYRVYGIKTGSDLNVFYEIVMPGVRTKFEGGGQNFFWYQPRHENGNILTYPAALGSGADRFIPDDMGSFLIPADGQDEEPKEVHKPQVPASLNFFDGNGTSSTLRWSDEITEGTLTSGTHSTAESADIKMTYSSEVTNLFGSAKTTVCGSLEFRSSTSSSEAKTKDYTTSVDTAITLNKGAGIPKNSYPFYPVVYTTKDGTIKTSFAVPNPADPSSNPAGYQTYSEIYGGKPDPALNLPGRFQPVAEGTGEMEHWAPNTSISRKAMRGLFFRHSEYDTVGETYLLYARSPIGGDKVRVEARVYNLSTGQPAHNTDVEFQVIPYNSMLNSEVCESPINQKPGVQTGLVCPRSARKTIGTKTINKLLPLQSTCVAGFDNPAVTGCNKDESAYIDWDTSGYAPAVGTTEYRVYVVLNPNSTYASEIYPIESAPMHITHVENATPMVVTAPGNALETGDYVTIGGVQGLTGANGTFRVTKISANEFSLNDTNLSSGNYTGGGLVSLLDPGQNNEGYGTIGVSAPFSFSAGSQSAPQDYLGADALEALSLSANSQLQATTVTATQYVPLELRFTAHSSMVHTGSARVLLYDGDPASGAPAIADQLIYPGLHGADGTSIWLNWTPKTTGQHHLVAVLVEGSSSTHLAGNLNVNVLP